MPGSVKISRPSAAKTRSLGPLSAYPLDLRQDDLGLAAFDDTLDRRRRHLGCAPRSGCAAVLADIERAIGTEHTGIGRSGDIGKAACPAVSVDRRQLAAIAFDQHDAAVGQDGRPFRPAKPGCDGHDRRAGHIRHKLLPERKVSGGHGAFQSADVPAGCRIVKAQRRHPWEYGRKAWRFPGFRCGASLVGTSHTPLACPKCSSYIRRNRAGGSKGLCPARNFQ